MCCHLITIANFMIRRTGGIHNVFEDEIVAVASADILTQYVTDLLNSSYDMCFRQRNAGFVLYRRRRFPFMTEHLLHLSICCVTFRRFGNDFLYHCKLVDASGFVLFDNRDATASESPVHITQVEPDIARSLIDAKVMEHSECMILDEAAVQRTYKVISCLAWITRWLYTT